MAGLSNTSILVTGGTGFVGSHLVRTLLNHGHRVIVPYRAIDPKSYFATESLASKAVMVYTDLKNLSQVFDLVTRYEIDHIFHLGAQAIVETAFHNPLETLQTNIMGTVHVLEAARRYKKVKTVIVASSDKAYGKSTSTYTEKTPLKGDHPYEVSKSAADLISSAYFATYRVPVIITRFGNIFGPGDTNYSRILPGIMQSYINSAPLRLRSDGSPVRDYVYVKDVVSAYEFLLKHADSAIGQAFNISSEYSFSVKEFIAKADVICKKKLKYIVANTAVNEIPYQHLDDSRIRKMGWKNKYTLQKAVRETYAWYKRVMKNDIV